LPAALPYRISPGTLYPTGGQFERNVPANVRRGRYALANQLGLGSRPALNRNREVSPELSRRSRMLRARIPLRVYVHNLTSHAFFANNTSAICEVASVNWKNGDFQRFEG
jgi:hypothetical protein